MTEISDSHPLKDFWLVRRALAGEGNDPLGSIMDIDDPIVAQQYVEATGKKFNGDYLVQRAAVERWLGTEAESLGIISDGKPPLYFYLSNAPEETAPDGYVIINIPAYLIPPEHVTATVQDSFINYAVLLGSKSSKVSVPEVHSATSLARYLEVSTIPEGGYIECQVWNRALPVFDQAREVLKGGELIITIPHEASASSRYLDLISRPHGKGMGL